MATIRKRTWRSGGEARTAWICDYRDQHGKRRFKQFARKRDADAWLTEAKHQVGLGVHTPDASSVTVGEAADLWLARAERDELEPITIRHYRAHVEHHIRPLLGAEKLSRLTTPMVRAYLDRLLETRSRPMAAKVMTSLRAILREAQGRALVAQNVATGVTVTVGRRHRKRIEVPSKDEVRALVEAATGRSKAVVVLAAFCGLRG